jgi:hypothetical protein
MSKEHTTQEKLDIVSEALSKLIDEHKILQVKADMLILFISDLCKACGIDKLKYAQLTAENLNIALKMNNIKLADPDMGDDEIAKTFNDLMESLKAMGGSPDVRH